MASSKQDIAGMTLHGTTGFSPSCAQRTAAPEAADCCLVAACRPALPHLEQEVEVRHAGEHLKQEDGQECDDVVLGRDNLVGHKVVPASCLTPAVAVDHPCALTRAQILQPGPEC